jgi:hypothetical protein
MTRKSAGGTYGQQDVSPAAQRNALRKDQHFAADSPAAEPGADPFREAGFAAGGAGHSGYGGEYGMLEPSQRHEKQAGEQVPCDDGTPPKPDR